MTERQLASHQGDMEMTTNFTCSICHKGFDNRRSCVRHVSYCRRKSRNPPRSRRRACLDCSKAKTHCDAGFPACSRCLDKNITCRYQTPIVNQKQSQCQPQEASLPSFTSSSSSTLCSESFIDDSLSYYPPYTEVIDFRATGSLLMDDLDQRLNGLLNIYQPALRPPQLFWPKEAHLQELSVNRRNGMPPFVHSSHLNDDCTDNTSLPGPLARCSGIMAMWSVKTKHNSFHIWKAIRSEQERVLQEYTDYNDWDAVAALQAICVYVILRVLEKDEDVTDFDIPLIQTVLRVGRHVGEPDARHCRPCSLENPIPRWESWILDESTRRTMFIIFIVISLFDASAGLDYNACGCAEYLSGMALPSTKSMWNSRTGTEWEQEYMDSPVQSDFGGKPNQVLTFGDLLLQQNNGIEYESNTDSNSAVGGLMLDQWLARVDEIGSLVISAAKFSEDTFYR